MSTLAAVSVGAAAALVLCALGILIRLRRPVMRTGTKTAKTKPPAKALPVAAAADLVVDSSEQRGGGPSTPEATALDIPAPARSSRRSLPSRTPASTDKPALRDAFADSTPIVVSILGPAQVFFIPCPGDEPLDITPSFTPRMLELIVFLALHRAGVAKATVLDALWPDAPAERPDNGFHSALLRMRRAVSSATKDQLRGLTATAGGRYQLAPATVSADFWHFDPIASRRPASLTDENERVRASTYVTESFNTLADGIDTEWIIAPRESARSAAMGAVGALASHFVKVDQHSEALRVLESALQFAPYDEMVYCDIIRLLARLRRGDAIPAVLTALTSRLAELGLSPSPATLKLVAGAGNATTLLHPRPDQPVPPRD